MPLLRKRRVVAFKLESVAGTAETLTAAEAAFNAYESDATPNVAMALREGQSSLAPLIAIAGQRVGQISFEVDHYTAPGWESMLSACGMDEATADIWTPSTDTSQWSTATVAVYMDGKVYRIMGAMGTATWRFRAGIPTRVAFTFTGAISTWGSDATILAPTYPLTSASAPRWAASTLTLGGAAVKVSAIDIALNNQVAMLEDATVTAGVYRAWIASRAVGGTMDPEEALAATRDDFSNWLTPTELALSIAYGTTSFSVPKFQWINLPTADRNGASILQGTWQANRSAVGGDDELSIDLST